MKRSSDFAMNGFRFTVVALLFVGPALGQDFKRPDESVPLRMDWSDHHVVYTVGFPGEQVEKMQGDPRYFVAMRLHGKELADENAVNGYSTLRRDILSRESPVDHAWQSPADPAWRFRPEPPRRSPIRRPGTPAFRQKELKKDWSVSLGPTAGVAAGQYPAKFTYDVNAAPNCTTDYAVFPVNAATGSTRTHVVGTFSTSVGYTTGTAVTLTVTPTGGSGVMTTLTPSTTANTLLNFQVFGTANQTNANAEATNLAKAINRNINATNAGAVVAVVSTNTLTVYALTPGTRVVLSTNENLNNFSFAGVTTGANGTQANIVGFNNLYAGTTPTPFCSSPNKTFPTFIFSYASGVGSVTTSPVISLDGTKIAYIENGPGIGTALHVLTFGSGSTEYGTCSNTGTGTTGPTCATFPVIPGSTAGSTAKDFVVPLSVPALGIVATDTRSAPFVNYTTDTLYVGDDQGYLYAVTGVFMGTPTIAGGNFPVAVSTTTPGILNSPVVDVSGTGNIFLGDSLSNAYEYSSAGVLAGSSTSIGSGTNGGIWDGAVVDSTNGKVYFTTTCNTSTGESTLAQIPFTASGFGTVITSIDTNGLGCGSSGVQPQYAATPDNLYYTEGISSGSTASNGHILVSYQGTGSLRLAEWGFVSGALQPSRLFDSNFYVGASVGSSPSTEFYGSSVAYTPTALTQTGRTVTVTTATNSFVSNQVVTIAKVAAGTGGCTAAAVAAINGEQTVTVTSTTTFTFTSAVSATINSGNCTLTGSSATGPTQDYIFFGSGQPAIYTFTLPMVVNQNPQSTNTTSVTGAGGNGAASATSGIIVDNDSTSGQASSLYFGTQATSTTQCGTTAAFCAVKLTQTGLQ